MANRNRINPLIPSIVATSLQAIATVYIYSIEAKTEAVVSSATLTLIYIVLTVILNTEHKKQ